MYSTFSKKTNAAKRSKTARRLADLPRHDIARDDAQSGVAEEVVPHVHRQPTAAAEACSCLHRLLHQLAATPGARSAIVCGGGRRGVRAVPLGIGVHPTPAVHHARPLGRAVKGEHEAVQGKTQPHDRTVQKGQRPDPASPVAREEPLQVLQPMEADNQQPRIMGQRPHLAQGLLDLRAPSAGLVGQVNDIRPHCLRQRLGDGLEETLHGRTIPHPRAPSPPGHLAPVALAADLR
mmetsp:Transcript_32340/g.100837  ORF Transcript_32340/g.100837 Transcript_32340/m.100837 type:complete len:235 (+) Transcript_32340:162-866(+)